MRTVEPAAGTLVTGLAAGLAAGAVAGVALTAYAAWEARAYTLRTVELLRSHLVIDR